MYKNQTVAVVIPAYNEARFIGTVIETVPDFVDRIYAIDDCSTDETWKEIQTHARQINEQTESDGQSNSQFPDGGVDMSGSDGELFADGDDEPMVFSRTGQFTRRVVPIRHETNQGVGAAIKTGYRQAYADEIDVTAVMNGDGQMDPDILDRIIEPVVTGQAEYAKGNRLLHPQYRTEMSAWRFFGNSVLSILTKAASGYWKMSDPQNGYTAISYHALDSLDFETLYDRFGFLNHLLVHLNLRKMPIADVAVTASYGDETSKIEYSSFVPKLSALLVRSFFGRLKIKYLVFDFHPLVVLYLLGVIGIAGSFGGLLGQLWRGEPTLLNGLVIMVAFLLSSLLVTLATVYDMRNSAHLEHQWYGGVLEDEIEPETRRDGSAGNKPQSRNQ